MKRWLGKSAVMAVHYSQADDSLDSIDWLTYERSDNVNDNIAAMVRTALTYSAIATKDLIIDLNGQLWQISNQHIEAVGGAPTLRNAQVTVVQENALAVTASRIVAVSMGGYSANDEIMVRPLDGSPEQTIDYRITNVIETRLFGGFQAQRLDGVAA